MSAEHIFYGGKDAFEVDAVMVIEPFVFGGNECAHQYGTDFLKGYGSTVLVVEASDRHTVGTNDNTCIVGDGVFDVTEAR